MNDTVVIQTETVNLMIDISNVRDVLVTEKSCYVMISYNDGDKITVRAMDDEEAKLVFDKLHKASKDHLTGRIKSLNEIIDMGRSSITDE
jgi:hypothetical protein